MAILDGKLGGDTFEWSLESVLNRFPGSIPVSSDSSISWSPYHYDVSVNGRKAGAGKKKGIWLDTSRYISSSKSSNSCS